MGGYGGMGMGGYGSGYGSGGMSGFYNPMSGMMGNFGGMSSPFEGNPAEEAVEAEKISMEEKNRGSVDRLRQNAQDLFYFANVPNELKKIGQSVNGYSAKALDTSSGARALQIIQKKHPALALKIMDAATGGGLTSLAAGTALESALPLAGPIGLAITAGTLGYKVLSNAVQTGQEFGALTGATGANAIVGGYGADVQSFMGSFLNPLMPSGISQEIESTGLASGYGSGGNNYLNQYRSFASGAFERFQMSPQESQQMFQNAVVIAGGSLNSLSSALQNTANLAVNSGISFQQATQNFNSMVGTLANYGMKGSNVINTAAGMNAAFSIGGQQMAQTMSGVGNDIVSWSQNSLIGQAMTAQTAGVPITNLYGYEQNHGIVNPAISAIGSIIGSMGGSNASPFTVQMALGSMGLNLSMVQTAGLIQDISKHPHDMAVAAAGAMVKPDISNYKHDMSAPGGSWDPFNWTFPGGNLDPANWVQPEKALNNIVGNVTGVGSSGTWNNSNSQAQYNAAMKQFNESQAAMKRINSFMPGTSDSIGNGNSNINVNVTYNPSSASKYFSVSANNSSADSGTTGRNSSGGSVGVKGP